MDHTAAALSFVALGVTLFGLILPYAFRSEQRELRWVSALNLGVAVWLAAQGCGYLTGDWSRASGVLNALANLLPGVFLAFALSGRHGTVTRRSVMALVAAAVFGALAVAQHYGAIPRVAPAIFAWQVGAWSISSFLMLRRRDTQQMTAQQRVLARAVVAGICALMPLLLVSALISKEFSYGYFFPVLMIALQFLLLIGVARLKFYDIDVRAIRAGELASDVADAQRLAVLGELTATLAHEIRNPLTAVRSLAQRLSEEALGVEKQQKYARLILEETTRVERLVSSLLGASRRVEPDSVQTAFSVREALSDLKQLVEPRARKKGVRVAVDADDSQLVCSHDLLRQTVLNLVINAIAQAPASSVVTLRSRAHEGRTIVEVLDEGAGIAEGAATEMWKPFFSTTGSTGLGLAVVERIARENGWSVSAMNRNTGGATFAVTIPS